MRPLNQYFLLTIVLGGFVLFTGCSSIPKPVGEIAGAKAQIESAETNEANKYAPVELDRAKSKLKRAENAVLEKDNLTAKRLADESLSDAKLATAKASTARARNSVQEMRNTVQNMKQEIERVLKH